MSRHRPERGYSERATTLSSNATRRWKHGSSRARETAGLVTSPTVHRFTVSNRNYYTRPQLAVVSSDI